MEKKRVLIVDDEEIFREIILFALSDEYNCTTANDSFDAYDKIWKAINEGKPYDVITLDEVMPGMDGIALLKILRINEKYLAALKNQPLRFVIISGVESKKYLEKMYKTVMEDRCAYIKKPFDQKDVLEVINNILD